MNKEATPRYMKEYAAALGSNPAKAHQIFSAIPPGKTRSIPGPGRLGEGGEGFVVPAITGGKGESAVKVFTPEKVRDPEMVIGPVPYKERGRVMAANPSVFPEIYGYGDRHIAMERLRPTEPGPLGLLLDYSTRDRIRKFVRAQVEAARVEEESGRGAWGYKQTIRELLPYRNIDGKYSGGWSVISRFLKDFDKKSGGRMWITDVTPGHNIMVARGGRLVISDPLVGAPGGAARGDIPYIQLRKGEPPGAPKIHGIPFARRVPARAPGNPVVRRAPAQPALPQLATRYRASGAPRYTAAGLAGVLGALAVPSRAPQGDGR